MLQKGHFCHRGNFSLFLSWAGLFYHGGDSTVLQWLKRKKIDNLKKKATQVEVLRAKERDKKRKQRRNKAEIMKKAMKPTTN